MGAQELLEPSPQVALVAAGIIQEGGPLSAGRSRAARKIDLAWSSIMEPSPAHGLY